MLDLVQKRIDETRQGEAFQGALAEDHQFTKHFYIESYGCQMNFSDSEIIASILQGEGFGATRNVEEADLIFLNTCSIREKAEQTVRKRLTEFKKIKRTNPDLLIGVLGCMAERLKSKLLEEEKLVDLVVGPDAYRTLPSLIEEAESGTKAVNVLLSREETYADISPVRINTNGISAFVSIMRGCNNMCAFCVVPFTRGRERSRDNLSIVEECKSLFEAGYKEVTLLGQNVDSYYWVDPKTNHAKEIMPDCAISSDIIAGFCTEEEQDHLETLDIMRKTAYEYSYMFAYSERPGTLAAKRYKDDVPEEIKKRRLDEIVQLQNQLSLESNKKDIGKVFEVLIEGDSKKSHLQWMGRNSQYKVMVFDKADPTLKPGSYVHVQALECTQGTLMGKIVDASQSSNV